MLALPALAADTNGARFLRGLRQPWRSLQLLLRERDLLRAALVPVFWLLCFCAGAALLHGDEEGGAHVGFWRSFYRTFALLAPVPSILFAGAYARLAAQAHDRLFGPCRPRAISLWLAAQHALRQLSVVAIALAPLIALLGSVPALGQVIVKILAATWALHWIVVEALDGARVLPMEGPAPAEIVPRPFFVRFLDAIGQRLPWPLRWPVRRFAAFCCWLCRPWHEEIAHCERHPALLVGFALTTAALLSTPVLNLFFRPIIIVAAVGLTGEFTRGGRAPS